MGLDHVLKENFLLIYLHYGVHFMTVPLVTLHDKSVTTTVELDNDLSYLNGKCTYFKPVLIALLLYSLYSLYPGLVQICLDQIQIQLHFHICIKCKYKCSCIYWSDKFIKYYYKYKYNLSKTNSNTNVHLIITVNLC